MASKTFIQKKLAFREDALAALYDAYTAIARGKVKSYQMDDRTLTKLDLPALYEEIKAMEDEINELSQELNGTAARKAYAVIPRNW